MSEDLKQGEITNGDNKTQVEKAKMNIVYVGIASVVMFFGGLSSAYIVSMGDAFWLKFPLPTAFWISTAIIAISSITFQWSIMAGKKGNSKVQKIMISVTLFLGLCFAYSQYQGYFGENGLAAKGSHFTGSGIIVADGKYGSYFTIKQNDEFIYVDGNDYMKQGKVLSEKEMKSLKDYTKQFLSPPVKENFKVKDDGIHTVYWEDKEMTVIDGELFHNDSIQMQSTDRVRLAQMSQNIQDDRGHFFIRGKIGRDFQIYYQGVEMKYKNGNLLYKGRPLDKYMQLKALESPDTASSFLWAITFAHLLHVLVTLLYMVRLVRRSFSGRINQDNNVHLRMGAVFWHFLGILWLLLLLFLLFIH